jgi:hypothetical protein
METKRKATPLRRPTAHAATGAKRDAFLFFAQPNRHAIRVAPIDPGERARRYFPGAAGQPRAARLPSRSSLVAGSIRRFQMQGVLRVALAAVIAFSAAAASAAPMEAASAAAAPSWDQAGVARSVEAARQARRQGDLMAAERLCHAAFQTVEESALAAYDAYADRLAAEHGAEAATVRQQATRLHELKEQQSSATQPTSTYLGFSTSAGLQAYAELLRGLGHADEAERMRSLALAYQQVQQANFQRTQLFQQGKDPRGSC